MKIYSIPQIVMDTQWAGTIEKINTAKVNRKCSHVFDLLVRSPHSTHHS